MLFMRAFFRLSQCHSMRKTAVTQIVWTALVAFLITMVAGVLHAIFIYRRGRKALFADWLRNI